MKKIAILIENQFDEQELFYPYHRLREDYQVDLIGTEKDTDYISKSGVSQKSDLASRDVKAEDYAGVFIPGGFSPDYMRRSEATIAFVKEMIAQKKPVAAICHGPWVLASADGIRGKQVTSFPSLRVDLENAGAHWLDEEVVVADNIITSRSPRDLPANLREFLKAIKN
ncbi:MAG: type 1 glutamine amidotransferase domain-containing protein [Tissierellia bacterium]|nr:type 1 glutamine amidotransferase domain-containing protein [Tissierellia bacterium]